MIVPPSVQFEVISLALFFVKLMNGSDPISSDVGTLPLLPTDG